MADQKITVGAIGVGPVGSILGVHLADAGCDIVVADLPFRNQQIQDHGIDVTWQEKKLNCQAGIVESIENLAEHNPSVIFIATKAAILPKIMPAVAQAAGEGTLVISVHNGIGPEDKIAEYIPEKNVARMVVNYAGSNDDDGFTRVNWFNPPNFLGHLTTPDDPRLENFVGLLNSSGLTSEMVDSYTVNKKAFLKTVLNSALMPVCAVLNLTMNEAMANPVTRQFASDLLKEGFEVGKLNGYDYGEGIHETCMGYLDMGGNHHPSMSVDLQNKRGTEIDYINGKILEIGQEFDDVVLDTNRIMVGMIMTMEIRNGTRDREDVPAYLKL